MNPSLRHLALATVLLGACAPISVRQPSSVALPDAFEHSQAAGQAGPAHAGAHSPSAQEHRQASGPAASSDAATSAPGNTGNGGNGGNAIISTEAGLARWWQSWQDPVLGSLIEQGLAANHALAAVQQQLAAARAVAALAQADLGPQLGLGASTVRLSDIDNPLPPALRPTLAGAGLPAAAQENFNQPGLRAIGLLASWEPDIFGSKRSDADAARQAALAETERLHGARLMLAADIADHYLQVRALQQRIAQGSSQVAILQRLHRYVQARFAAGQANAHDRQDVAARLSALQASLVTLDAQAAAHVRSLAVLTGQTPQGFRLPDSPRRLLGALPAAPSGQKPMAVLERRPDVRANARLVQARIASLASAQADRYPRLDIHFLWQHGRISLDSSLPGSSDHGGLFSASLNIPLFTAGRIQRNIDAADARLKSAIAHYDHSLLKALAEVDSAYQMQYRLHQQSRQLAQASALARQQADSAEQLFRFGEMNLDRLLSARLQAEQLAVQQTLGELAEARNLLLLYKALGGGWQNSGPETAGSSPTPP